MTWTKPVNEVPEPRRGPRSEIHKVIQAMEPGTMIEISDLEKRTHTNILRDAKSHGFKVTTRKTATGTLKVYRL